MKPSQAKNLYEILGIERNAAPREIDVAFRKLALQWHPDKNIDDSEAADAEFKILMNAYCILSEPARRQEYDRYHFNKTVNPNYGSFRDERLSRYRARQRAKINSALKKNERKIKIHIRIAKYAFLGMLVSVGSIAATFFYGLHWSEDAFSLQFPFLISVLAADGCLMVYFISRKEISDIRKRSRILAIKLYTLIDES
jgi:curved DNA-binding protein CbpA